MTSSKEDRERVRLLNKCNDYANSFSRRNFFKLSFDSYTDISKIIQSFVYCVLIVAHRNLFGNDLFNC